MENDIKDSWFKIGLVSNPKMLDQGILKMCIGCFQCVQKSVIDHEMSAFGRTTNIMFKTFSNDKEIGPFGCHRYV